MRTPFRADGADLFWTRSFALPIRAADRVLDSEVELRQNVASSETEHQEHLRRPATNSFDLDEVSDELVIVHCVHGVQWKRAGRDFSREVAQVADLLARKTRASQLSVRECEESCRLGFALRKQSDESRVNRPGRFP